MKRTPLARSREKPRRKAPERVQQVRIKPRAKAAPTAEEQRHLGRVAARGCCVTGRPGVIHHVMHMASKSRRRDHRYVVCLIPELHNMGPRSVHGLGGEAAFLALWGVDLVAIATEAWDKRDAPDDAFWRDGFTR